MQVERRHKMNYWSRVGFGLMLLGIFITQISRTDNIEDVITASIPFVIGYGVYILVNPK